MMLYLSEIIKMKFLFGTTWDDYDEYKEIEIKTLEELIELIKNSEWKQIVMRQNNIEYRDDRENKFLGKRFIEDYNDRRE
jgi:hypothetical protein